MKENVFTVDLGDMRMTDAQRKEINAAIQTAVTSTLAKSAPGQRTVLFPINKWPKGPIIWGIIARPWDKFDIGNVQDILGK
jgi:hypothetical protein